MLQDSNHVIFVGGGMAISKTEVQNPSPASTAREGGAKADENVRAKIRWRSRRQPQGRRDLGSRSGGVDAILCVLENLARASFRAIRALKDLKIATSPAPPTANPNCGGIHSVPVRAPEESKPSKAQRRRIRRRRARAAHDQGADAAGSAEAGVDCGSARMAEDALRSVEEVEARSCHVAADAGEVESDLAQGAIPVVGGVAFGATLRKESGASEDEEMVAVPMQPPFELNFVKKSFASALSGPRAFVFGGPVQFNLGIPSSTGL